MADSKDETSGFYYHKSYYFSDLLDRNVIASIKDFTYKEGDVLVAGFQKSGNHWMIQILMKMYDDWGLCEHDGLRDGTNLDWLSCTPQMQTIRVQWKKAVEEQINTMPSPRLLRSHLPIEILCPEKHLEEKRLKIICLTRNPKDLCISWYHYMKEFANGCWAQSFDALVPNFATGKMTFGPWLNHVTSWHKVGLQDNVLHVKYEDLRRNPEPIIRKIAEFLNQPLTDAKIKEVAKTTTFEAMKESGSDKNIPLTQEVKHFLRKGKIGDWKTHFTVAQNEYFDKEITEKLVERGIHFQYE